MGRLVNIDGDALRKELQSRGLSQSEAGKAIYKSDSFFSKVIKRNAIQKSDVEHIASRFNIPPEAYVIMDKPEPEQMVISTQERAQEIVIIPEISAEQWARLERVIAAAVKEALSR